MRDIAVFLIFIVGLYYALKNPYYGVLLWSLFDYLNPHRLAWGPAFAFPFVYIIAIVTIISFFVSRDKKPVPVNTTLVVWVLFVIWMGVTTIFALEGDSAYRKYIEILKIQAPIFMVLPLFYNKERVDQLVGVIALSIAFYGVKGGIFTLMTGGQFIVWGPSGTFIFGNNELAVAILSVTPLLFYLRKHVFRNIWIKRLLVFAVIMMVVSAIGTQSRGAFLALLALGGYYWWRSDRKGVWAVVLIAAAVVTWFSAPSSWKERMATIQNYEEDGSAMGRIRAWRFAIDLANARLTGGGLNPWTKENYLAFSPSFTANYTAFVAHSIYFSVLGEHGWIGLFLYLWILWLTWRSYGRVNRLARGDPEIAWMADLANVCRVGLVTYLVGGAFLSIAYFDLPWHFVAISILLDGQLKKKQASLVGARSRSLDAARGDRKAHGYRPA